MRERLVSSILSGTEVTTWVVAGVLSEQEELLPAIGCLAVALINRCVNYSRFEHIMREQNPKFNLTKIEDADREAV